MKSEESMLDTVLGVLGIAVSLLLFVIGYRQTVGAKKERVAACNQQVENILVRRIVLEAHVPKVLDIARLIEGKARDFRVGVTDVLSVAQTLNVIYTRVTESDVIPGEQRQQLLDRIRPALEECEAPDEGVLEAQEELEAQERRRHTRTSAALGAMAVMASLAGALVTTLPVIDKLNFLDPEWIRAFLATVVGSLGVIAGLVVFYKFRISQEAVPTR
jgi:hypothetical protein